MGGLPLTSGDGAHRDHVSETEEPWTKSSSIRIGWDDQDLAVSLVRQQEYAKLLLEDLQSRRAAQAVKRRVSSWKWTGRATSCGHHPDVAAGISSGARAPKSRS